LQIGLERPDQILISGERGGSETEHRIGAGDRAVGLDVGADVNLRCHRTHSVLRRLRAAMIRQRGKPFIGAVSQPSFSSPASFTQISSLPGSMTALMYSLTVQWNS